MLYPLLFKISFVCHLYSKTDKITPSHKLAKTLRTYEWIFNKENWSVDGIDCEALHPVFGEWVTMA